MRGDRLPPNGRGSLPRWLALFGCLGLLFGALAAGCGLDDSAVTVGQDSFGKDASFVDSGTDTSIGDSGTPDTGPTCTPKTCAAFPGDCHTAIDDGCGGKVDCSAICPGGQACVGDGGAGAAGAYCNGPPVCADAGAVGGNCGTLTNAGTGQTTTCVPSTCTNTGYTCNSNVCTCAAGGTVCGAVCCSDGTPNCNATNTACCKKKTCAGDYVGKCANNADDGCAGTLDCSNNCDATADLFCGKNQVCAAKPACPNKGNVGGACGTITDTVSGLSIDCGVCRSGYSCGANNVCTCDGYKCGQDNGSSNKCGCTTHSGYDYCYTATSHCDCDNGDACSACDPGFKQCHSMQYRWCIPSTASCN